MTFRTILFEVEGPVATVTLNRADEKNAIDDAMRDDFAALAPLIADDRAIRVVIFTGAGSAFSAGGSVAHFEREWNTAEFRALSRRLSAFFDEIEAMEKPAIAALNGVATGAGLQLAMACDLRIAAASATLGFREHRLGLIPGHGGATRLVKLVGLSRAKGLYFAGDLVSAAEAERIGLVHRVVADGEALNEAKRIAADLATRAPAATGLAKQLLNAACDLGVARGIQLESLAQSVAIGTRDHREGVRAFRERRRPTFEGE
jgi:enoyl-CoA hydratase